MVSWVSTCHIRRTVDMRTILTLCSLPLLGCATILAHGYAELDINDVRARFYANGRISKDTVQGDAHFEVPQGSGVSALRTGGIWISGTTADGQLRLSKIMNDDLATMDLRPGPLTNDGMATTTLQTSMDHDHVWSVTRSEILMHRAYFNCLSDPNCDVSIAFPGGYTIPQSILDWPAMGPGPGYDLHLAPFLDHDNDGLYEPFAGDAPCILGDQALFSVFNDHIDTPQGHIPLGIEVKAMPFAYNSAGSAMDATVLVHYHVINRSTSTYSNVRFGMFNDFDLGCSDNDFIGSDPARNLVYVYNWVDVDAGCNGVMGYGEQPPAFGMFLLKGPLLDATGTDDLPNDLLPNWNGVGFGDAIPDNERSGVTRMMYFVREGPSAITDPVSAVHFHNYLHGKWKDGRPLTYGGNGYSVDPNAVEAAFAFPGGDDPVGAGTGGVVQPAWLETSPTPATPDRRSVMSMGDFTLEPGEHLDMFFAYVHARAAEGGASASVEALKARVDSVRSFANTLPIWLNMEDEFPVQCINSATVGIEQPDGNSTLLLAPVPARDLIRLQATDAMAGAWLRLCDATGRVVSELRLTSGVNEIAISGLAPGIYSATVITARTRYSGRFVKQ